MANLSNPPRRSPYHACVLVGQSHGGDVSVPPRDQSFEPSIGSLPHRLLVPCRLFPPSGGAVSFGGGHGSRGLTSPRASAALCAASTSRASFLFDTWAHCRMRSTRRSRPGA